MFEIVITTPSIKFQVAIDFNEIESELYRYRTIVAKIGKQIKFLRRHLDEVDKFPHLPSLIDKNRNILKFYNYNVEHYKLERATYNAIIKKSFHKEQLPKILTDLKSEFKDLFNKRLDNLEDAMSKEYFDEGTYLEHNNGIKNSYDNTMREFDIFDYMFESTSNLCICEDTTR
jgi:hypothetical protein